MISGNWSKGTYNFFSDLEYDGLYEKEKNTLRSRHEFYVYRVESFHFLPVNVFYSQKENKTKYAEFHKYLINHLTFYAYGFDFPDKHCLWSFTSVTEKYQFNKLDLNLENGIPLVKVSRDYPIEFQYNDYYPPKFEIVDYLKQPPPEYLAMVLRRETNFTYKWVRNHVLQQAEELLNIE